MVSPNYMLARPASPGSLKRTLDRVLLPASINFLYRGEMLVQVVSGRIRRAPVTALLAALGCGYVMRAITRRA